MFREREHGRTALWGQRGTEGIGITATKALLSAKQISQKSMTSFCLQFFSAQTLVSLAAVGVGSCFQRIFMLKEFDLWLSAPSSVMGRIQKLVSS